MNPTSRSRYAPVPSISLCVQSSPLPHKLHTPLIQVGTAFLQHHRNNGIEDGAQSRRTPPKQVFQVHPPDRRGQPTQHDSQAVSWRHRHTSTRKRNLYSQKVNQSTKVSGNKTYKRKAFLSREHVKVKGSRADATTAVQEKSNVSLSPTILPHQRSHIDQTTARCVARKQRVPQSAATSPPPYKSVT